jgi:hypothetical protein
MCAGIVRNTVVDPYLPHDRLLKKVVIFWKLFYRTVRRCALGARQTSLFQHNGDTGQNGKEFWHWLKATFPAR